MNPKVAHFTNAFYSDRGGYATVENVSNLNIYANIGTASQPGCFSSSTDIHSNSILKYFNSNWNFLNSSSIFLSY